jgi:hypothetical protein
MIVLQIMCTLAGPSLTTQREGGVTTEVVKTQAEASQRQRVKQWAAAYKRNTHRALAELLTFIAEVTPRPSPF